MPTDRVYGTYEFREPVLQELIASPCVQRLKGISQAGVPQQYDPHAGFNRYEHSIGVPVQLQLLDAPLVEVCAGLLHDVSHTAFSHVVDWALGTSATESFQDDQHAVFLERSGVEPIIRRYGMTLEDMTDHGKHSLLEQEIPELCADRVDYALRNYACWSNPGIVPYIVSELRAHEGRIVLASKGSASLFANEFLRCQTEYWASAEQTLRYNLLAGAIKHSLQQQILTFDDLYTDDAAVLRKMQVPSNPLVDKILSVLWTGVAAQSTSEDAHLFVQKKFRYVDPMCFDGNRLVRLSAVDEGFSYLLERVRAQHAGPMGIRITDPAIADWYSAAIAPLFRNGFS
jgi:uncharacterized protein